MTMHESNATQKTLAQPRSERGSAASPAEAPQPDVAKLHLDPHVSYDAYAEVRAKAPVVRVSFSLEGKEGEGAPEFREFLARDHLFVTRYEQVISALLDSRFSADPRSAMTPEQKKKLPPLPEELRPLERSILTADPPDHGRLRKLVQPSFSARAMEALRPRVQQITEELLDDAARAAEERGEAAPDRAMELIKAFAYPLPVTVICDMLGIPREDREQVRGWTENLLNVNRRGRELSEEARSGMRRFTAYLRDLFAEKRRSPADDMISQLIRAEEDGDKLDEDEVLSMVLILFLAGHVTTVNLIGNGVFGLLTHPDQLAKFKADPGLVKGVVEETLRCWGPVDFISRRIAKEDLEIGGTAIPKGEPIMVGLASANRDPERFTDPEVFDISRPDADRHIAFGKGIHLCVGAPLARMEGQIAFETLFRRFPDLRLAVPADEVRWGDSFLRGIGRLPVLF
ncbi:cytochrome P450 family protein [Sorangium sp. So ce131]|uniref:cytochrome P450 family protein n=1 Tax=Sorangium sp. So ce131 TaxID=3133282 RepID=UPI003F6397B9